MSVASSRAI